MNLHIATAPKRNSLHWQPGSVTWEGFISWLDLDNPASKKEAGNYVLGQLRETTVLHKPGEEPCTGLHRRKDAVVLRSGLTLDLDSPKRTLPDTIELTFPYAALLHPTWSHSPDAPRYRLVVRLDRDVTPDEYIVCCEAMMQRLGQDQFDPGSSQPERYMFRPSTQQVEWYRYWVIDGPPAPVDDLLAEWNPDLSLKPLPTPHKNKRDPYSLEGVIGAFNRAYEDDWDLLIEQYDLPYQRVSEDRFQLVGARGEAGMGPIPGTGFVYSHHANDPAYDQTCSAFDLVRLHRFGYLDEGAKPGTPVNKLPSQLEMQQLAGEDHRVTAELVEPGFSKVADDDPILEQEGWKTGLVRIRQGPNAGQPKDVITNWDLIRRHDPVFLSLRYNELSMSPELAADVPWRTVTDLTRIVTSNDRWELTHYLERTYGLRVAKTYVDSHVDAAAWQRVVNPVRDWLKDLVWDGVPRLEECLPGVRPTAYTRFVARKVMVAAVARMFQPGCKWDHVLVLHGPEGLGKTWWVDKLARGYSSPLGRIDNKDTLLICQQSWIVTADENHSMRKTDQNAQKEFITRTSDMFRMPYDRETLIHPRHWVVWSTTNDDTFLRRQEGNRRFLVVHCQDPVDFESMTEAYVTQLWAEAVYLYRAGEKLYLGAEESTSAASERERFLEEDVLVGVVLEYLETKVPEDWWSRRPEARQSWMYESAHGFAEPGQMTIDRVCSAAIWVEALGRRIGDARRADLLDITNVLKGLPGWQTLEGRNRVPGYGPQLVFVREDLL